MPIFDHKNKNDISKDDTVSQKKTFTHVKPFHPKLKIKPIISCFSPLTHLQIPCVNLGNSTLFWPGFLWKKFQGEGARVDQCKVG